MTIISKRLFPLLASATLGLTLISSGSAASADELAPAEAGPLEAVDSCFFDGPQLNCTVSHPNGVAGVTVTYLGQGIQGTMHYSYMYCASEQTVKFDPPTSNYSLQVQPCSSDDPDFAPETTDHGQGQQVSIPATLASGNQTTSEGRVWDKFCDKAQSVKNKDACKKGWVR